MGELSHEEYRNTEYWHNLRLRLLDERGGQCEKCCKVIHGEDFDLHHINGIYSQFDEDPRNLMVLCRECHRTYHRADYVIPDGTHDFKVTGVQKKDNGAYVVAITVKRKYDNKECRCWNYIEPDTWRERAFRNSIGLPEWAELERAINSTGRAIFTHNHETGFNEVVKFFTKV